MIHPQLQAARAALHATMLVYLFTDAELEPAVAADLLHHAVEGSFNRISIDGDTSTNDTVLLLASGASGIAIRGHNHDTARTVADQRTAAFSLRTRECLLVAGQAYRGGRRRHSARGRTGHRRGAHRCGCSTRCPLHCPLTAGQDRMGRMRSELGPHTGSDRLRGRGHRSRAINISFGELEICEAGCLSPGFDEAATHEYLKQRDLTIHVDLGLGSGTCRFWTTDLTTEYIRINSDYST